MLSQSLCGITGVGSRLPDIANDDRACADDNFVANGGPRPDCRPDANQCPRPDTHVAAQVNTRGDVSGLADHAVMVDRSAGVDDNAGAEAGFGDDGRSRGKEDTVADAHRLRDERPRVDDRFEGVALSLEPIQQKRASTVVADPERYRRTAQRFEP